MNDVRPMKTKHVIAAMENALYRRDYPVLNGLLNTFEGYVREVGDSSVIESVQRLRVAADMGTEIERGMGRGSQLDPDNAQNQHWLRVGMFSSREVPEALVKATYGQYQNR